MYCASVGSSGQLSPASSMSGPSRPSPIPFDDVDVPDMSLVDLTAAIQSTFGPPPPPTSSSRDPGHQGGRPSARQGQVQGQGQGRSVLEELSDRLQRGNKSRDAVTSRTSDVTTPRAGRHDNGVRGAVNYPLSVGSLHLIYISLQSITVV